MWVPGGGCICSRRRWFEFAIMEQPTARAPRSATRLQPWKQAFPQAPSKLCRIAVLRLQAAARAHAKAIGKARCGRVSTSSLQQTLALANTPTIPPNSCTQPTVNTHNYLAALSQPTLTSDGPIWVQPQACRMCTELAGSLSASLSAANSTCNYSADPRLHGNATRAHVPATAMQTHNLQCPVPRHKPLQQLVSWLWLTAHPVDCAHIGTHTCHRPAPQSAPLPLPVS